MGFLSLLMHSYINVILALLPLSATLDHVGQTTTTKRSFPTFKRSSSYCRPVVSRLCLGGGSIGSFEGEQVKAPRGRLAFAQGLLVSMWVATLGCIPGSLGRDVH